MENLEAIEFLNTIFNNIAHTLLEKKMCILGMITNHQPGEHSLKKNLRLFKQCILEIMIFKTNYHKKDERLEHYYDRILDYCKENESWYSQNHADSLTFQQLYLLVGIAKNNFPIIRQGHLRFLEYMELHLLRNGKTRDCHEHDSLEYQWINLHEMMEIVFWLQKYGYHNFSYLNRKTQSGASLIQSFAYLKPFLKKEKLHFLMVKSIYEQDRSKPQYGQVWDPNSCRSLLKRNSPQDKKIEHLYKILKEEQ